MVFSPFPFCLSEFLLFCIVLFSRGSNRIIFVELTVPCEEAVKEAYERKLLRYLDLLKDCIANGWNAVWYPVEIGAQGFIARSMVKLMKELGMGGKERQTLIRRLGETTERSSNWLWLKSGEKEGKVKS